MINRSKVNKSQANVDRTISMKLVMKSSKQKWQYGIVPVWKKLGKFPYQTYKQTGQFQLSQKFRNMLTRSSAWRTNSFLVICTHVTKLYMFIEQKKITVYNYHRSDQFPNVCAWVCIGGWGVGGGVRFAMFSESHMCCRAPIGPGESKHLDKLFSSAHGRNLRMNTNSFK